MARPLYLVSLLLVLLPMVDLAVNVWPLRPGDMGWRYGTVGLLAGFTLTPLLGLVLAMALAGILGHHRTLRWLGILSLLGSIVLVLSTGSFTLDVVQIRLEVPAEGRTAFWVGAIRSWAKNLVVAAGLFFLWRGAARAAKEMGQAAS